MAIQAVTSTQATSSTPDLYNGVMGAFLKKFETDFVAHAINAANVKGNLGRGLVEPKEKVFREGRTTNYELGQFNQRATIQIPELWKQHFPAIKALQKEGQILGLVPIKEKFGGLEFPTRFYFSMDFTREADQLFAKIKPYGSGYNESLIAIMCDELNGRALDKRLAEHYREICQATLGDEPYQTLEQCKSECRAVRNSALGANTLDENVRAGKNCIWWGYGDVVVLRGEGSRITSCTRGERPFFCPLLKTMGSFSVSIFKIQIH